MKNIYQDGLTIKKFRLLHLRYETGRYYWDQATGRMVWYWDYGLFEY